MFLNTIKKILESIFPQNNTKNIKIKEILKNRIFYFKKEQTIYFLPYKNKLVRKMLYDFKFKKKFVISKFLGEILYENLNEILYDLKIQENFNNPILIQIPISFSRKLQRGYDQNSLIIKEFCKLGGDNFLKIEKNILYKKLLTSPQSKTKKKKERLKNIKNSFKVKNVEKIKNKNILLFDDIKTSGATLNEAKKILKKAGVKKIIFLTIAH